MPAAETGIRVPGDDYFEYGPGCQQQTTPPTTAPRKPTLHTSLTIFASFGYRVVGSRGGHFKEIRKLIESLRTRDLIGEQRPMRYDNSAFRSALIQQLREDGIAMSTKVSDSADFDKPDTGESTPRAVHLGRASDLTRGGFYTDEDNDGVRKTK
jgi:hypothetical protein